MLLLGLNKSSWAVDAIENRFTHNCCLGTESVKAWYSTPFIRQLTNAPSEALGGLDLDVPCLLLVCEILAKSVIFYACIFPENCRSVIWHAHILRKLEL